MTTTIEPQYDGPRVVTVSRAGNPQYAPAWGFKEIRGFWKAPMDEPNMNLVVGQQYVVTLKTKENPGHNPYTDIVQAEPLTAENMPEGYEERIDPQGQSVVAPTAPAATPEDYDPDNPEAGPQPAVRESFSNDPVRDSIEKQVFYKDFNPDATAMLTEEEQAAMLTAYYSTAMELVSTSSLNRAVQAFKDAQAADGEARDA